MSPWNLFRRRKVNEPILLDDFTNKYTQAENTTDKFPVETFQAENTTDKFPVKTFQDAITDIKVPTIIKEEEGEVSNHTQFKNLCNKLYDILQKYLRAVDKFYVDAAQEKDLTHKLLIQLLTPLNQLSQWNSIPSREYKGYKEYREYKDYSFHMKTAIICLSQLSSQPQSSILYYDHIDKFKRILNYFEVIHYIDVPDITFVTTKNSEGKASSTKKSSKTPPLNEKLKAFNSTINILGLPSFNTDILFQDLENISKIFYILIKKYFKKLNHPYHDIMNTSIAPDKIPRKLKSAADYLIQCASYLQQIKNSDNNYNRLLCPIKNLISTLSTMAKGRSNIFSNSILKNSAVKKKFRDLSEWYTKWFNELEQQQKPILTL